MAEVHELTPNEFTSLKDEKDKLIVVDFYAEWCMPCLMMAPVFESVADKNKDVRFGKINIEDAQDLAEKNNVSSIPCIIFFKDGKEVDRIVGSVGEEVLEEKIQEHVK